MSINAISFQYFRTPAGDEILGRVHFLEPEQVESKAREKGGSKRRRALSLDDLEVLADDNGVGSLYRDALSIFQPFSITLKRRDRVFRWQLRSTAAPVE